MKELTQKEKAESEKAVLFVRKNHKEILDAYFSEYFMEKSDNPISIFMAGSPGAGKTEISKLFLKTITVNIIRIDADDFREHIPGYNGKNSAVYQSAASLLTEKAHDYCLKNDYSFIFDSTAANFSKTAHNIERSLKRNRKVFLFYVFTEPKIAWDFTVAREAKEGRNIPKEVFIEKFLNARDSYEKLTKLYKGKMQTFVFTRDMSEKLKVEINIDKVENFTTVEYNKDILNEQIG